VLEGDQLLGRSVKHGVPLFGRAVLAEEWYAMLDAPSKELITFEHSGHRPSFEQPAAFAAIMTRVLAETSDSTTAFAPQDTGIHAARRMDLPVTRIIGTMYDTNQEVP
jgi:hypothetical protein